MAPHKSKTDELTDILVRNGAIAPNELVALHHAFHESDADNFEEFLLDEGIVDTSDVLAALSEYYKVPSFDVFDYFFERSLLQQFPKDFLLRNGIIPVEAEGDTTLLVVAADPTDPDLLAKIGEHVSYDIAFNVGIRLDIQDAIKEYYDEAPTEVRQDIDRKDRQRAEREEHHMEYIDNEDDEWEDDEEDDNY